MVILTLILMRILYRLGLIRSARINHPLFEKMDATLIRAENQLMHIITLCKTKLISK